MKTNIYETNYNAYQPYLLLDFSFSFENDIAHDDISRTVIDIVERINLGNYIDFDNRNAHGYNAVMMFTLVLLAKTLFGYVSTRHLASLCKTDVRFMSIAQNQKPSHQSFHRFIHDDLTLSIEDIFYDINKYMESRLDINTDILCIDGTKYEANANKNKYENKEVEIAAKLYQQELNEEIDKDRKIMRYPLSMAKEQGKVKSNVCMKK